MNEFIKTWQNSQREALVAEITGYAQDSCWLPSSPAVAPEKICNILFVRVTDRDGKNRRFQIVPVRVKFDSVQFEKHQSGNRSRPFVAVDKGMVLDEMEQVGSPIS